MDALAAHLNELSTQQPNSQPEAPPRNNRNKQAQSAVNNNVSTPISASNQQQVANNLDSVIVDSESDSEPEDNGRVRNDGTLLASDPPKPL